MKLGLRDIDWEQVGAELAVQDDEVQGQFFKSFLKECNSWGTSHRVGMQLCRINDKLTKEEKETISMLGYSE